MRYTLLARTKSIAGSAFIGVGVFIFYNNASQAFSHWTGEFGTIGLLPAVIVAALRGMQAYASDRPRFLLRLFEHGLVTFWPLLLVIAGTVLSQDACAGEADIDTKKDHGIVDLTVRRSTLK